MKKYVKKTNGNKNHGVIHSRMPFRGLPGDRDMGRSHVRHDNGRLRNASIRSIIEGFLC